MIHFLSTKMLPRHLYISNKTRPDWFRQSTEPFKGEGAPDDFHIQSTSQLFKVATKSSFVRARL